MIKLVHFPRGFGIPSPSPFCMKAEILMKMAGLEYEEEIISDPRKGPKDKLPFIIDDGVDVADSTFIQHHLETKYNIDFDEGYDPEQRATGHAYARMAEERLYWGILQSRWMEEKNWPQIRRFFFGELPPVIRSIVPNLAHRQVTRDMKGHGIGNHGPAEIYELCAKDIDAVAAKLGDSPFLLGDTPCSADAAVYPILQCLMIEDMRGPLMNAIEAHDNLVAYCRRCHDHWFSGLSYD